MRTRQLRRKSLTLVVVLAARASASSTAAAGAVDPIVGTWRSGPIEFTITASGANTFEGRITRPVVSPNLQGKVNLADIVRESDGEYAAEDAEFEPGSSGQCVQGSESPATIRAPTQS